MLFLVVLIFGILIGLRVLDLMIEVLLLWVREFYEGIWLLHLLAAAGVKEDVPTGLMDIHLDDVLLDVALVAELAYADKGITIHGYDWIEIDEAGFEA